MSARDLSVHQIDALAHFDPATTVHTLPHWYRGGPSDGTMQSLVKRDLLWAERRASGTVRGYALTLPGAETLRLLRASGLVVIPWGCVRLHGRDERCGPDCYRHSLGGWDMSSVRGVIGAEYREALAWAPEVAA